MNVDFAVVCDYAIVDQYGKLSVLGIFQHIWVPQLPAVHPRLHLVIRLKGKRTEGRSARRAHSIVLGGGSGGTEWGWESHLRRAAGRDHRGGGWRCIDVRRPVRQRRKISVRDHGERRDQDASASHRRRRPAITEKLRAELMAAVGLAANSRGGGKQGSRHRPTVLPRALPFHSTP